MQPIDHQGIACLSLKQLDELNGLPKGSSFRAFKRVRAQLREGEDFFYLSADAHRERIEQLRAQALIYQTSTHVVLIARRGYELMRRRA